MKDRAVHNRSMLMKWHWRYNWEDPGLWKDVISAKYGSHSNWTSNPVTTPHGTGLWKGIRVLWEDFSSNTSFQGGNGETIKFWKDTWLGNSPLKGNFPNIFLFAANQYSTIAQNREQHLEHSFEKTSSRLGVGDLVTLLALWRTLQ